MAEPVLKLIQGDTGEVVDGSANALMARVEELEHDLAAAERELRTKRRQLTKAQNELTERAKESELMPQVEIIFRHWQAMCHHPKSKLGKDRIEAAIGRLKDGYTVAQCCKAIDGIAADPNTERRLHTVEKWDDMEIALRSSKNLEKYANRAPR